MQQSTKTSTTTHAHKLFKIICCLSDDVSARIYCPGDYTDEALLILAKLETPIITLCQQGDHVRPYIPALRDG